MLKDATANELKELLSKEIDSKNYKYLGLQW